MSKLVEVALPLEAISVASRRDKDRKTGTIKNVHKWFAPMPTPAWRALLFATLVDDPGDEAGRAELLRFVERLVPDHGGAPDEATLAEARQRIHDATGGDLPTVFDPFCGGGSTLVEAQRLGLPAAGSDLNPVPVLITRVLTELVPQVAGRPPLVGDPSRLKGMTGGPLDGFLADCRHYAERVRQQVWDEIGHLYPPAPGGGTVIAWLWARTVTCPNPACRATAPLASSFWLSKRKGADTWVEPVDGKPGGKVRFEVRTGSGGPPPAPKVGRGGTFRCVVCGETIGQPYVRVEACTTGLGVQLIAAAASYGSERRYLSPPDFAAPPSAVRPLDAPANKLVGKAANDVSQYGMLDFADIFTSRQLVALCTFADTVAASRGWVAADGGDETYARSVASVLGLCVSKLAASNSMHVRWRLRSVESKAEPAFGSHALPMLWDFAETNPFGGSVGDWLGQFESLTSALRAAPAGPPALSFRSDARTAADQISGDVLLATDPPYFGQIGYADLSDYFYIWLRRALVQTHPDLFATIATPKAAELIAAPHRHEGNQTAAKAYFVEGFTAVFRSLGEVADATLPRLIVYAHTQEDSSDGGVTATAWDAMLTAILSADLRIVGTWPIHATSTQRQIGQGTNALASYVVLVCRPQVQGAKVTDRQGFLSALRADLPRAIRKLQEGAISVIDLGQATIGPGMAIFSRFGRVIEPSGQPMTVQSALELIALVRGEVLDEFVGDLDPWTRWAMTWYRDHGFEPWAFDEAEKLCKSTNTSVDGLVRAGIVQSGRSKVTLRDRDNLPVGWSPADDQRVTVWEVTQHLTKRLHEGGESAAAELLAEAGRWVDEAFNLAYWLADVAAHRHPKDVADYDALVTSWPELVRQADSLRRFQQSSLAYGDHRAPKDR